MIPLVVITPRPVSSGLLSGDFLCDLPYARVCLLVAAIDSLEKQGRADDAAHQKGTDDPMRISIWSDWVFNWS